MTITLDPLSVQPSQIGDTYDLALGCQDPDTGMTRMVGYVLAQSGTLTEGTNLQDEEHLVQIASPSSSDRYGRFPRVSQGDWSGGERQLIFINANAYYQSTQLNTTIPGHLTCNGFYFAVTVPNGINPMAIGQAVLPRTVANNERRLYFLGYDGTNYWISVYNLGTGNLGTQAATAMGAVSELMRNTDYAAYVGAANGIWAVGGSGVTITITPQVTNDAVQVLNGASMATFQGSAYYLVQTMTGNEINSATYPLPGAGAGTTVYTTSEMEVFTQVITRGGTGLIFTTGRGNGLDQYVYDFDGVNANYLGRIEGNILDCCEANGTVYILTAAIPAITNPQSPTLPVIYSIAGSTLSIFDDFRKVDDDFWPTSFVAGGHLESDGAYLYFWYAGLSTKRYLLTTSAVMDIGNPICVNAGSTGRAGTPLGDGGFVETEPATSQTTAYVNVEQDGPNADGILLTSWFDFGTPDVDKAFKAIEFTMNSAVSAAALLVSFQVNSPANPLLGTTVNVSPSGNTLVAYLPQGTLGRRIRFQITLNHQGDPDVQSYGITATLARVFQATVACNRQQHVRGGSNPIPDPQKLTSTELLANIQRCYTLAGGNVTMYIPDPTVDEDALASGQPGAVALGVSMIQAQLQDYQRSLSPGVSAGMRGSNGPLDIEATVQLTLTEQLG